MDTPVRDWYACNSRAILANVMPSTYRIRLTINRGTRPGSGLARKPRVPRGGKVVELGGSGRKPRKVGMASKLAWRA